MNTYRDKILKEFKMDQSKKGFLPVLQGVKLSQTQCPTTAEDREKMEVIPYASAIGSIMYENKVWTLVDLPEGRQAIENKWIFKKKTDADGNVTVYKARLVAKGF